MKVMSAACTDHEQAPLIRSQSVYWTDTIYVCELPVAMIADRSIIPGFFSEVLPGVRAQVITD
jgi:hypothetical protein